MISGVVLCTIVVLAVVIRSRPVAVADAAAGALARRYLLLLLIACAGAFLTTLVVGDRPPPLLGGAAPPSVVRAVEMGSVVLVTGWALWQGLHRRRISDPGQGLATIRMLIALQILVAIASTDRASDLGMSFVLVVSGAGAVAIAATWVGEAEKLPDVLRVVRFSLIALTLVNAISPLLVGSDAYFAGDRGMLPVDLPGRLAGITAHPNTLGAIAGAAFLVAALASRSALYAVIPCGLSMLVLLASGSRTCLVAALGVLLLVKVFRVRDAMLRLVGLAVLAVAVLVQLDDRFAESYQVDTSVTSREVLWDYVLANWRVHALLGHGALGWGEAQQRNEVPTYATHAHDQWLNWLFLYGLIGLVLGAALWLVITVLSVRVTPATSVPLALTLFQLVRSVTESSLALDTFSLSSLFICSLVLLTLSSALTSMDRKTHSSTPMVSQERE